MRPFPRFIPSHLICLPFFLLEFHHFFPSPSWPYPELDSLCQDPSTNNSVTMCGNQLLTSACRATRLYRAQNCTHQRISLLMSAVLPFPSGLRRVNASDRISSFMRSSEGWVSIPAQPMHIQLRLAVHVSKESNLQYTSHISHLVLQSAALGAVEFSSRLQKQCTHYYACLKFQCLCTLWSEMHTECRS
jgi:hypothetical protein